MTEEQPAAADPSDGSAQDEEARRRRRAAVFGDLLPDSTSDERADSGSRSDRPAGSEPADEEWLRRQVPPHHG